MNLVWESKQINGKFESLNWVSMVNELKAKYRSSQLKFSLIVVIFKNYRKKKENLLMSYEKAFVA